MIYTLYAKDITIFQKKIQKYIYKIRANMNSMLHLIQKKLNYMEIYAFK